VPQNNCLIVSRLHQKWALKRKRLYRNICARIEEGKNQMQNYSLDELREMKELTETIKQNLAAIEATGWTLTDLDDMRNEAAAVVTNLHFIDESEWDLDALEDMRKEAESTVARLEAIERAS
jgi:hypothetical protein